MFVSFIKSQYSNKGIDTLSCTLTTSVFTLYCNEKYYNYGCFLNCQKQLMSLCIILKYKIQKKTKSTPVLETE